MCCLIFPYTIHASLSSGGGSRGVSLIWGGGCLIRRPPGFETVRILPFPPHFSISFSLKKLFDPL